MNKIINSIFPLLLSCLVLLSCKKSSEDTPVPPAGGGGGGGAPRSSEIMINGYVPDWKALSFYPTVDYENLTIAFFAFVVCDADGNVIADATKQTKMESMIAAAHAANTKAYLSFGGGAYYGSTTFFNMANNETSRKEFAHQVKELCLEKGFDGFDVDWEGLPNSSHGLAHEALMQTLRDTLHSVDLGLIVTVQQGGSADNFTNTAMNYADLVQIMSYDLTGTWAGSPVGQHSSYTFARDGLTYWSNRGIAKSKLVVGLPFYGYRFASMPCPCQTIPYSSVVSSYPDIADGLDYISAGPLSQTYFNGFSTIMDKVSLAYEERTPGVMIWEMSQDATGDKSLLTRTVDLLAISGLTVKKLESSIP